jgi:hypothetical protein
MNEMIDRYHSVMNMLSGIPSAFLCFYGDRQASVSSEMPSPCGQQARVFGSAGIWHVRLVYGTGLVWWLEWMKSTVAECQPAADKSCGDLLIRSRVWPGRAVALATTAKEDRCGCYMRVLFMNGKYALTSLHMIDAQLEQNVPAGI